jgi:hypothetical protein
MAAINYIEVMLLLDGPEAQLAGVFGLSPDWRCTPGHALPREPRSAYFIGDGEKVVSWAGVESPMEMKKGAGASPLFVIDTPKPVTESRIGSGHPGKPILYVAELRANRMPCSEIRPGTDELIESTAVRYWK